MEILRKVKCSERLPEKEGNYFVDYKANHRSSDYISFKKYKESKEYWIDSVEYWYEPIEIELKSEEILPKEERDAFSQCEILNKIFKFKEALIAAELKIAKLKAVNNSLKEDYDRKKEQIEILEDAISDLKISKASLKMQLGEGLTKEFFRKQYVELASKIKEFLPPTFYNDRPLEERFEKLVDSWNSVIKAYDELSIENQSLKLAIERNHGGNCIIAPKGEVDKIAKERYEKAYDYYEKNKEKLTSYSALLDKVFKIAAGIE